MKMKIERLLVVLLAICFFTPSVNAFAVEEKEPALTCNGNGANHLFIEVGTGFYKNYLCSTSGAIAHDRPVFQGYGKITYETPRFSVYIKTWGSKIIVQDGGKMGGDEWDQIITGIAFPVGPLKFDVGYGYYDLHPQFRTKGDLHCFFGTVSFSNKYVEPYLTVECDIPTHKKTFEGGWYYRAGIAKCFKIRQNLNLTLDISVGGNDGAFCSRPNFFGYTRGTAALACQPIKACPNFSIIGTAGYQTRLGHDSLKGGLCTDTSIFNLEAVWKFDLLGN